MADAPVDVSKMSGLLKETYADDIETLTPSGVVFQKDLEFIEAAKQPGNFYHQPVMLTHEHGFSYAPAGVSGAFDLLDAVACQMKDAYLAGTQMVLKTQIGLEIAARASTGGQRAFKAAIGPVVENMWASSKRRIEASILYGQMGLGKIEAINHTTGVITIYAADWAPGIWCGQEGAIVRAYNGIGDTPTQHQADLTISAVDLANKQITVTGTNTNVVADDYLFFKGERDPTKTDGQTATNYVFAGMHKILANAGSLFGIDAATYSLWAANSYAVGGALTFAKIQKAVALAMGKGLDEDLTLYINPGAWADLLNDEAALRRHVKGGREAAYTAGANGLEFYSQNGVIRIKTSIYMKEGIGMMISPKLWKRIGATDLTFRLPDRGDEFFMHLQSKAGYELRNYINHSIFCKAPGKNILLTGIVNT